MKRGLTSLAIALWAVAVIAGASTFYRFEWSPGVAAAAPAQWPSGSRIAPARDRATLVMLMHPHCPCSRASLAELAVVMERCEGLVDCHVLVTRPPGVTEDWLHTPTTEAAAAIPGVDLVLDDDGVEARRVGANTSGQVVLYDAAGRLLFSGGITGARGHAGDNAGRAAVIDAVMRNSTSSAQNASSSNRKVTTSSVFGCPLFTPPTLAANAPGGQTWLK